MTKKKSKTLELLLAGLLWAGLAHAQHSINTSGGVATGSGGTLAYSVGQIDYTTNTGSNGSVAQGVQQPYEISTVLGIDNNTINIELTTYPNPTTNFFTLNVGNVELSTLNFQMYNISGNLIESRKIISSSETIKTENLPATTYFLKVSNNTKEIKTFKIIKN